MKKSLFCEIWNNPTPPLFFITPVTIKKLQEMELYDKFVDTIQDLLKVKNPAVSHGLLNTRQYFLHSRGQFYEGN